MEAQPGGDPPAPSPQRKPPSGECTMLIRNFKYAMPWFLECGCRFFVMWFFSDMDLMKEKFAKLLLGEDMSGGGKGVSSALALSNAITNLAGILFVDFSLEP